MCDNCGPLDPAMFSIKGSHVYHNPDGRRVAFLYHGNNGEWYVCGMSKEAHAYPVGSLDNVKGTGHKTRRAAYEEWLANPPF